MKALIDTNVIIDNLASRAPYDRDAKAIFNHIATNRITGYISISSITDVYYIIRKVFNDADSKEKIRTLMHLFEAIVVTKEDCFNALDSSVSDFEDALVVVCTEKEDLDYIVTRDIELLKLQNAISPSEFLNKLL